MPVKRATAAKPRAKKKAATVVGEVDFRPMGELDLLPGDEVELRACSPGDVVLIYIGIIARDRAFKAPGPAIEGYTWPPLDTPARGGRRAVRERQRIVRGRGARPPARCGSARRAGRDRDRELLGA